MCVLQFIVGIHLSHLFQHVALSGELSKRCIYDKREEPELQELSIDYTWYMGWGWGYNVLHFSPLP